MHVCARAWQFCLLYLFWNGRLWSLHFNLYYLLLFWLSNWQITDSVFLLFLVLHFVYDFHMCCAKCFACSFVCLFEFWFYVCNSSLALFFTMLLRLPSFIFIDKLFIFALFAYCRFFPVLPPRFSCLHALEIYSFFVSCFVCLFSGVR